MKISRRHFVKSLAGLALAGAASLPVMRMMRGPSADRPNILLLLADDMRWDALSCMNHPFLKTPGLDALAGEGLLFRQNFVTTSVCAISRASIYTGDYALNHGVYSFYVPLKSDSVTFMDILREQGYYTGFIGKWGIGGGPPPRHNYDYWDAFRGQDKYWHDKEHLTDLQTKSAARFLKKVPPNQPFALIVAYKAPHEPFDPAIRFRKLFTDVDPVRSQSDTKEEWEKLPKALQTCRPHQEYNNRMGRDRGFRSQVRNYCRLIAGVDDSVQRIVDTLKTRGLYDDTSVYFTSDNGFMLGEHQLFGKACMYEESIRTPLIVKPSRFPRDLPEAGGVTERLTLNVDLAATILSECGISPPTTDGRNIFTKEASDWRQGFYYEFKLPFSFDCEGYRDKQYKYTVYMGPNQGDAIETVMYDLVNDPLERSPLKEELHSELYAHYKERMLEEKSRIIR